MSLRITSAATVLTIAVGAVLASAPAAAAAPPLGTVVYPQSMLISQGYICTATRCTRPGSPIVFICSGGLCSIRV